MAKAGLPQTFKIRMDESAYPQRLAYILGGRAPKSLSVMGNLEILFDDGVGFCGSRSASAQGLDAARDCAEVSVSQGVTVVSGNAKGVDRVAHRSALANGGRTVLVLAEGISRFRIPFELSDVWDWNRVVVIRP